MAMRPLVLLAAMCSLERDLRANETIVQNIAQHLLNNKVLRGERLRAMLTGVRRVAPVWLGGKEAA